MVHCGGFLDIKGLVLIFVQSEHTKINIETGHGFVGHICLYCQGNFQLSKYMFSDLSLWVCLYECMCVHNVHVWDMCVSFLCFIYLEHPWQRSMSAEFFLQISLWKQIGEGNSAFFDNTAFTLLTPKGILGIARPELPIGSTDMLRRDMASSPA